MNAGLTPLLTPSLLAQLDRLELASRKQFRGRLQGDRPSSRRGRSVELADFRNYVAGDELRLVDWNAYARLDRLILKLYRDEEDLHLHCLIDASRSMEFGQPTKLFFARQLAAALAYVALARADRVSLEVLGSTPRRAAPSFRGRNSLPEVLRQLDMVEANENVSLVDGVKNFCLREPPRGLVVLITDLLDKQGFEQPLRLLLARGMDVCLVHVLSREELQPALTGDLRLIDCEDGDAAEVSVSAAVVERYLEHLSAFLASIREFCTKRGINYLPVDNQLPVEQLIGKYLRERGLLR
jgi:uncharacterized protein (DUF58 family)